MCGVLQANESEGIAWLLRPILPGLETVTNRNVKKLLTVEDKRNLAGMEGFEPSYTGIKIRCLNRLATSLTLSRRLV